MSMGKTQDALDLLNIMNFHQIPYLLISIMSEKNSKLKNIFCEKLNDDFSLPFWPKPPLNKNL